jgi:hypothetical protein
MIPKIFKSSLKRERFITHLQSKLTQMLARVAAASTMATVYGYEVKPSNDRFVALSEKAVKKLSDSFLPGAAVVNAFPILRYMPSWMPGAGFQRVAAGGWTVGRNQYL